MRLAAALLAQALLLAACAVSPPDNSLSYRPGIGVVQDVRPARVALPPPGSGAIAGSEAAGGSYGSPIERVFRPRWTEGHQLTLRMDDGSTQQITQDSPDFRVGDRVQITREGRVVKTVASASPAPAAPAAGATIGKVAPPAGAPPAAAAYRPGTGIVESASVVALSASPSAAAGATGGVGGTPTMAYRLKMDDGSTQSIVQTGERFAVGDRVQVTREGRLARR